MIETKKHYKEAISGITPLLDTQYARLFVQLLALQSQTKIEMDVALCYNHKRDDT